MGLPPLELFAVLIIVLLGIGIFGFRAFIAWFRPQEHQEYLELRGSFFDGWPLGAKAFWTSRFNFWLMRLAFTLGLLLMLGMLLYVVAGL
jgi:hypothetical protein